MRDRLGDFVTGTDLDPPREPTKAELRAMAQRLDDLTEPEPRPLWVAILASVVSIGLLLGLGWAVVSVVRSCFASAGEPTNRGRDADAAPVPSANQWSPEASRRRAEELLKEIHLHERSSEAQAPEHERQKYPRRHSSPETDRRP